MLALHTFAIASLLLGLAQGKGISYHMDTAKEPGAIQSAGQKANLYWYSNYTVGRRQGIKLLLDTGSDDLILNNGIYHESEYAKIYPNDTFSITYEGINRAGQGTETVAGNIVSDLVSDGVLTVYNQTFGNATFFKYKGVKSKPAATAGFGGIIGWEGKLQSGFKPGYGSWFYNLCEQQLIAACRFGLALGTQRKGRHVVGKVDHSLFKDKELTYAPLHGIWITKADVTLNNKIMFKNQNIILDVGTTNMQAPSDVARSIFKTLGYQYYRITSGPGFSPGQKHLYFVNAFYPCDKPPLLGFSIPAEDDLKNSKNPLMSKKAKIFNMLPSEWDLHDHGNNNCSAILSGTNALTDKQTGRKQWLVGQPFFQGHYLDFQLKKTIGFGDLVNPRNGGPN